MRQVIFVGGGDFCFEICSYLPAINQALPPEVQLRVVAINDAPDKVRLDDISQVLGYAPRVIEDFDTCAALPDTVWAIAIGNPSVRARVKARLDAQNGSLISLIHPQAYVCPSATVGAGAIIAPFAFVGPKAKIADNVSLNVSAVIGHDAEVGPSSVVSPLANMNGHAKLGARGFLGAGSTMNPGVSLGADGKLTASSVLNKPVDDGFLMHGNPATGRKMFRAPSNLT